MTPPLSDLNALLLAYRKCWQLWSGVTTRSVDPSGLISAGSKFHASLSFRRPMLFALNNTDFCAVSFIPQKARLCLQDLPPGFSFDFRLGFRSVPPQFPLCALRSSLLGLRSMLCACCSSLSTLHSPLFAFDSLLCSLCSARTALRSARSGPHSSMARSKAPPKQRSGGATERRSDGAVEQGVGQLEGNASQTTKRWFV